MMSQLLMPVALDISGQTIIMPKISEEFVFLIGEGNRTERRGRRKDILSIMGKDQCLYRDRLVSPECNQNMTLLWGQAN